jgi:hypothetical protein
MAQKNRLAIQSALAAALVLLSACGNVTPSRIGLEAP